MAVDDFLATSAESQKYTAIMRLYSWRQPTLSCGYHQQIDRRVDFESCRRYGVDVVRRPTGGRELLHDGDLSFSILSLFVAEDSRHNQRLVARDFFLKACRVIGSALKALGIETCVGTRAQRTDKANQQPCLATSAQYEVLSNGKKVVPMAQRLYRRSVMVHGSIPLARPTIPTANLLRVENPQKLQRQIDESSANLYQLAGEHVDACRLRAILRQSFQAIFEGQIKSQPLSRSELKTAERLADKWRQETLMESRTG